MNENWEVVFTSTFGPKTELIRSLLLEHGIKSITLNQQDSSYLSFGEIKVLVRREQMVTAKALLESFND